MPSWLGHHALYLIPFGVFRGVSHARSHAALRKTTFIPEGGSAMLINATQAGQPGGRCARPRLIGLGGFCHVRHERITTLRDPHEDS